MGLKSIHGSHVTAHAVVKKSFSRRQLVARCVAYANSNADLIRKVTDLKAANASMRRRLRRSDKNRQFFDRVMRDERRKTSV